jgi:EmrB/QacA subfamily drug resistance transporter
MLLLDDTVVNVALPSIKRDLGFSTSGLAWVVNIYVLVLGGLILMGGRAADLFGRRRVFVIGAATFAVASLMSGLAQSDWMLLASRALQGVGGALVGPAAMALVLQLFADPAERAKAIGLWGGLAALGGTTGVVISGALTDVGSWRWIFLINLPVAALALALVPRLVDESRAERGPALDVPAAATLTGGLLALTYGLLHAGQYGWGEGQTLLAFAAAALLLGGFARREARADDPLIPLSFFRAGARSAAVAGFVLLGAAFLGMFFLLTLYMQQVLGYSPLKSGLSYLVFGGGLVLGIGSASQLIPRVGVRPVLVAGPLLSAAGLLHLAAAPVHGTYLGDLLPGMLAVSFGNAWSFVPLQIAGTHRIGSDQTGLASGLLNAAPQIGGSLGIAIVVALATSRASDRIADGATPAAAQVAGLHLALTVAAGLMVLVSLLAATLLGRIKPTAEEMRPGAELLEPSAAAGLG